MAGKVGLKEIEYTDLTSTIKSCHKDSISQIRTAMNKINGISGSGNAIDTEKISPKISQVIGQIRDLLNTMDDVYSAHEEVIQSFRNTIDNYDTLC